MSKRLVLRTVRALPPASITWDGAIPGFGARRRNGDAVVYVLKYRTAEGRQRWFTIGRHGAPWTPDTARAEDQLIPLIYLLQQGSPQVDKRGNKYMQDAEPGDFFLRTALNPIRSGLTGIEVQPCEMLRKWIEFLPNRGGYVTEHDRPPADLESRISSENGIEKIVQVRRSNNNIIQDTRQFFVLVEGKAYALPCKGTGHTFAKEWQTHFHQLLHPQTGGLLPAWAHKYLLTTVPAANGKGKWFGLKFADLGPVPTLGEYDAGRRFHQAVTRGAVRGEAPSLDSEAT
jgi:hypothetical protein